MTNNIILTGATGFLGSHLLKHLIDKTNYNIIILKRSFSDLTRISTILGNKRVSAVNIDQNSIESVFSDMGGVAAIIHVATDYGRDGSCVKTLEANLIYPIKLLELACKYNIELFINTDSYFNKDNMSYLYLQNYSLSKKSLNLWLKFFSKKIKIINLVLEHIYGDNDNPQKFTSSVIKKIAFDKVPEIDVTYGDQKRDFIFVDDVVDAYIAALEYGINNKFHYKKYEVGTSNSVSVKNFLDTIKNISKSNTKINYGAIPYRSDEIMMSEADNLDLLALGWEPKFTIESGIKAIIERASDDVINDCNSNI